ncbi:MAG: hypothetical protein DBX59_05865 [Bacillota bacterium]|nr:MAG: hypothetical protein DBX59_05865 [Bacillota bacterium]
MKKATKSILVIILVILIIVGFVVGSWCFLILGMKSCFESCNGLGLNINLEDKVSGDFIYHVLSEIRDGGKTEIKYIAIVGLSEEGKEKKEILIPQEIDGLPVECLGYECGWAGRKGEFESDVLEKLYILSPTIVVKGMLSNGLPAFQFVIVPTEEIFEAMGQNRPSTKLPKNEAIKVFYIMDENFCTNVVYYLNDGTETAHFADDLDGEKITFMPPEPTREGYIFGGWYKESECITAWDFENDVVPAKEYDDEGNYLFQETALYAKWIKN